MKLNVVEEDSEKPWYADGLKFTCSQCGNCCTGGPGFVWISQEEIVRLAEFLKITPEETVEKYCRKFDGRFSLHERRTREGQYDCIFLKEQEVPTPEGGSPQSVPLRRKMCSIYPVRPLQCRTWPFWPENLASPEAWDRAAKRCHGMSRGNRTFTKEQLEAIRDSRDWPENPPTSAGTAPAPSSGTPGEDWGGGSV
jgi:Fe-S-cluster containining protein